MMQPANGTMTWACGLAIVKGADLDKAYAMINGATSAETSAYLLSEVMVIRIEKALALLLLMNLLNVE